MSNPLRRLCACGIAAMVAIVTMGGAEVLSAAAEMVKWNGVWVTAAEASTMEQEYRARVDAAPPEAPQWGIAATSRWTVGSCDAGARDATHTYQAPNCGVLSPITGVTSTSVGFPVNLPTGALITSVRMNYFDTLVGSVPSVGLFQITGTGGLNLVTTLSPTAFDGGNGSVTFFLVTPHQVVNVNTSYAILAVLGRSGSTFEGIYGFEVAYRLQVSPAPDFHTFNDVGTGHPFHRFVEALVAAGITGGCGNGNYCPDTPVTRGQMAVFLATALGLHFPN